MGKKVVYNNCFGGFGLSGKAIKWLEENGRYDLREFISTKRKEIEADPDKLLSTDERLDYAVRYDFGENGLPRHDVDLVRCVETLGREADGRFADLRIHELTGNLYRIDEYDGSETVMEPESYDYIYVE